MADVELNTNIDTVSVFFAANGDTPGVITPTEAGQSIATSSTGSQAIVDATSVPASISALQAATAFSGMSGSTALASVIGLTGADATNKRTLANFTTDLLATAGVPAALRSAVNGASVNVLHHGADPTGATSSTAAFAAAVAAVPAKGTLYIPAGTYRGWIVAHRSDIKIKGDGSSCTTIKLPDGASYTVPDEAGTGTITGTPSPIEIGQLSRGNNAAEYNNVSVSGLTLDGNAANTTAPTLDLFGWGLAFTKTSNIYTDDIVAINCHLGGVGVFINSNDGHIKCTVRNCGDTLGHPGFDINSSKYLVCNIVSDNCKYGARLLDNCFNNVVNAIIYNAEVYGFLLNNQSVNESYGNTINVTVKGGCSTAGVGISTNSRSNNINASIHGVTGIGFYEYGGHDGITSGLEPNGNNYVVSTRGGSRESTILNGLGGSAIVSSVDDGVGSSAGDFFAVEVYGSRKSITAYVDGNSLMRGMAIRSGATGNTITSYTSVDTVEGINDAGTGTSLPMGIWTDATLNGGWSSALGSPYPAPGYSRERTTVKLRGTLTGGTGTAFTLPAGYRPPSPMLFGLYANGAQVRLQVAANGEVTILAGTPTSIELSGVVFSTV